MFSKGKGIFLRIKKKQFIHKWYKFNCVKHFYMTPVDIIILYMSLLVKDWVLQHSGKTPKILYFRIRRYVKIYMLTSINNVKKNISLLLDYLCKIYYKKQAYQLKGDEHVFTDFTGENTSSPTVILNAKTALTFSTAKILFS